MTANEPNAPSGDNSDGHDKSNDHESHTDSGVSRRRVLGAAASLPLISGAAAISTAADAGESGHEMPISTAGHAEFGGDCSAEVTVQTGTDAAMLQIHNEMMLVEATLLPEDIDALCAELQEAKAGMKETQVAETREYIAGKPSSGGASWR